MHLEYNPRFYPPNDYELIICHWAQFHLTGWSWTFASSLYHILCSSSTDNRRLYKSSCSNGHLSIELLNMSNSRTRRSNKSRQLVLAILVLLSMSNYLKNWSHFYLPLLSWHLKNLSLNFCLYLCYCLTSLQCYHFDLKAFNSKSNYWLGISLQLA